MCSSQGENRVSRAGCLPASSSFFVQVSPGVGSLPPAIFLADKPAGATFGNGTEQASGKTYSRGFWRNSRQRIRSIGIAHWWTALRCARPAGARKQAQIPRTGANWEANTICSPMPTASPWLVRLLARTVTMLPSCYPCSTASRTSKGSEAPHASGPSTYKATARMTPNPIARRSKKGGKARPGQASYGTRQRVGQNALVHRTNLGVAPSVPETENARRKRSIEP
jgi:hypothetical protein